MNPKLAILYEFLQSLYPSSARRRGKPVHYSWPSLVLFFMVMFLKGIHSFQAMARYAQQHYAWFGWQSAPCRQTLARRFEALPAVVYRLMPLVAQAAQQGQQSLFSFRWAFIDKSVFRAKGGLWHRKHRLLGIVPHASIDTEASWAKSAYHGWRFGYGLHLVSNEAPFPLACTVTTAAQKDTTQLVPLLVHFAQYLGVVVADAGYVALHLLEQLQRCWQVFVLLPKPFKGSSLTEFQQEYNHVMLTPQARWLYRQRKPSIERQRPTVRLCLDQGSVPADWGKPITLSGTLQSQTLSDDDGLHGTIDDVLQLAQSRGLGYNPTLFNRF